MAAGYKEELVGVFGHPVAENPTCVMQNAAFAAAGLQWDRGAGGPAQIVTLKDGQKIQFAGAIYGIMHVMGSRLARLADRLPWKAEKFVMRHFHKRLGPLVAQGGVEPTLVVWFQEV